MLTDPERLLDRTCKWTGQSRRDTVRDALGREPALRRFEGIRRRVLPFAEARGNRLARRPLSGAALRVLAERLEQAEAPAEFLEVSFRARRPRVLRLSAERLS